LRIGLHVFGFRHVVQCASNKGLGNGHARLSVTTPVSTHVPQIADLTPAAGRAFGLHEIAWKVSI
jgi:hypothetical protein